MNYDDPDTFAISGYITGPLTFTAFKAGWVLVGSRSTPLQVSSLQLSDDAKRMGSAFRYDITTKTYRATQVINPGDAVWMNVSKACTITIP